MGLHTQQASVGTAHNGSTTQHHSQGLPLEWRFLLGGLLLPLAWNFRLSVLKGPKKGTWLPGFTQQELTAETAWSVWALCANRPAGLETSYTGRDDWGWSPWGDRSGHHINGWKRIQLLRQYVFTHKWFFKILLAHFRRRQWHPTPLLLPGKSHGWRSLVGCSPWGRWGSDTTEQLHFHFSLPCIGERNGNPLQCSCLENPRDGGAWRAAVYGVAELDTTEVT